MKIIKRHPLVFIVFLVFLLLGCFFVAVNMGSIDVTLGQLFKGLFLEYDKDVASIYTIRFPRVIVAVLVGAALAVAGLIFQVVLKNPLADPGLLGVSNGAYLVSILLSIFFSKLYPVIPLLSFLGGVGIFVLIYSLSVKSGFQSTRIILIGVAINFTLTAVVNLIKSSTGSIASEAMGTLKLYNWDDVRILLIYLVPLLVIALFMAKACNLLGMEDRTLLSLGINVDFYRFGMSLLAVLLCSMSVAIAGVISFIGLIVPHLSRVLVGNEHKFLIPVTVLMGTIVLLVADTVGRVLFAPYEISSAVIMAVVGGPLFIVLLKRSVDLNGS